MFSVKWISYGAKEDILSESKSLTEVDLDEVFAVCLARFSLVQEIYAPSADGFVILDGEGKEVRRWMNIRPSEAEHNA